MTDLPAGLRSALDGAVPFSSLTLVHEARSGDGTVKALFQTADGRPVEAVLMRYRDGRHSLCRAAAGIAQVNAIGNIGGFLGTWLLGVIKDATGSYPLGLMPLAAMSLVGCVLVLRLGPKRSAV